VVFDKYSPQGALGPGAPANPDDFNNVFDAFKNMAAKNRVPKDKCPIISHLARVCENIDSKDSGSLSSLISHYFSSYFLMDYIVTILSCP